MPQIWMTYDELAFLFECEPATARDIIIKMNLDRRKSRDGHTRVKLDATLNALLMDKLFAHWVNCKLRACAGDLTKMGDRLTVDKGQRAG
jgi:hypothetical protein